MNEEKKKKQNKKCEKIRVNDYFLLESVVKPRALNKNSICPINWDFLDHCCVTVTPDGDVFSVRLFEKRGAEILIEWTFVNQFLMISRP